jgi:hypothetical protein
LRPILKEVAGLSDASSFKKVKEFDWIDAARLGGYGSEEQEKGEKRKR